MLSKGKVVGNKLNSNIESIENEFEENIQTENQYEILSSDTNKVK